MKLINLHRSFGYCSLLHRFIILSLIFFMLAIPVKNILSNTVDAGYELCENFGQMESEEKEDTSENEVEDPKPNLHPILNSKFHLAYNPSTFPFHMNPLGSFPDIPFPPPEGFKISLPF